MKKAVNHPYKKFLKAMSLASVSGEKSWGGLSFTNTDRVIDAWNAMSRRSKSKLVSDSRWNHYPLMSYTKGSKKRFGAIINMIVSNSLSQQREADLKPLLNNSSGIWAVFMLDLAPSSARLKIAKRLRKSPDTRVRTRCSKILPVSLLHTMLDDKHYSVRAAAIQRIGIDNCYKAYLPSSLDISRKKHDWWWQSWLSKQAISLAEPEELTFLVDQAKSLDLETGDFDSIGALLGALIGRMTPEDALFLMNLKDAGSGVSRALEQKLKHT
jgi:hypothetical protein